MTVRLFVRHNVADYAAWRREYDAFGARRDSMGVVGDAVYRGADNGNDVTVTHDFDSLDRAQAFMNSDELRQVMGRAGVVGEPQAWFAEEA